VLTEIGTGLLQWIKIYFSSIFFHVSWNKYKKQLKSDWKKISLVVTVVSNNFVFVCDRRHIQNTSLLKPIKACRQANMKWITAVSNCHFKYCYYIISWLNFCQKEQKLSKKKSVANFLLPLAIILDTDRRFDKNLLETNLNPQQTTQWHNKCNCPYVT